MSLTAGQTISSYEVLGPLGAGGMGEVYRARDTRLEREVALKVLPEEMAGDEERLRRLEREARTLASLNHPNVAGIHGVDQAGDVCFLVLELVAGEDLATRLSRGSLPVDEAIDVCRQITEGLEAAHEAGVVHRDLKPANVRITPEGVVKVLDFGLAKPIRPKTSKETGTTTAEPDSFLVTEEGIVLGTPTYMSPEQARGKPVDKRTDIWAFGCVLYECLTGRRAFGGDSLTDVLAAIVEGEPDWSALPARTPAPVGRLLRRCLDKDPRRRLRDIGEARIGLAAVGTEGSEEGAGVGALTARATRPGLGPGIALLAATVVAALAFAAGRLTGGSGRIEPAGVDPSAKLVRVTFEPGLEHEPVLSPDGNYVAYTTDEAGNLDIVVQPLHGGERRRITTDPGDDAQPAWSPDGSRLAFVSTRDREDRLSSVIGLGELSSYVGTGGDIFLTPALGGPAVKLVEDGGYPDWSPSGEEIVFQSLRDGRLRLWVTTVEGGRLRRLMEEEAFHPAWSPDGRFIACVALLPGGARHRLVAVALAGGAMRPLVSDHQTIASPAWSPDGRHVYFASSGESGDVMNLWRVAFEPSAPTPRAGLERLTMGEGSDVYPSVGQDGRLVFSSLRSTGDIWELTVAGGDLRPLTSAVSDEDFPHVSRGGRLAMNSTRGGWTSVWTMDLDGQGLSQMTPGTNIAGWGRWSPDAGQFAYVVERSSGSAIVVRDPRGVSTTEVASASRPESVSMPEWSPDGSQLAFVRWGEEGGDIWVQPLAGEARRLIGGGRNHFPTWSPDGDQIAYNVEVDGRRQVWLAPSTGGEGRRITRDDTRDFSHPQWSVADPDRILVVVDHLNVAWVSVRTGDVSPLTAFDESTVFVDYATWSPDGSRVYFHLARRTGDVFLLQGL